MGSDLEERNVYFAGMELPTIHHDDWYEDDDDGDANFYWMLPVGIPLK